MKKSCKIYLLLFFIIANQVVFGQCALTLIASSTNPTCSGCTNGTASVSVSGGTGPYTYSWTNNVSTGTANISALKDNSIYEQSMGNSNGAGDYLVAGETAAGFKNRALMAFDIAGNIPAGGSITNATLQLFIYLTSGTTGAQNHLLHRLEQNWGEGVSFATQPGQGAPATTNDATWLKSFFPGSDWTNSGGSFDPVESAAAIVNAANSFYNWSSPTMVADVQSWLNTPSNNFGWLLRSEETGPKQAKRYASKENSTTAWRPRLTVNYGPTVIGTASSVFNLAAGTYTVTVTDALGCTATISVIISSPITLPNIICNDLVLSSGNTYLLDGKVFVQCGATLFIEEGTLIKGIKKSTAEEASALIITRTGRLMAAATPERPIVFTSNQAVPANGDWGGIVILGGAPLNRVDATIEGINGSQVPGGVDITYGGGGAGLGNAGEDKGVLNYVRIEYAGAVVSTNNELNGLTCGGVGRGTFLQFIQTVYGADDAFEFFGGTVNAKYLIALCPDDDNFDFDFGYSGNIQYAVSVLNPTKTTYSGDPRGIESDNDATGTAATPRTQAVISNMTVIGMENLAQAQVPNPDLVAGATFRRNSNYLVRNSIFMGYPNGVQFESTGSQADVANFQYNIVHGFTATDAGASLNATNTEIFGNTGNSNIGINLVDPFNPTFPDFRPSPGSPAASGANFTGLTGTPATFFDVTTYRGAFPLGTNWNATWSRFLNFQ
ncbi:MAG: SprB repeat-containing protein [Rhizobacter sp.]|nr:SprB repeat-containing protein [Ferruginibacter sp.]